MEPTLLYLMIFGLCLCPAHFLSGPMLNVRPDRSRFFLYEQIKFNCSVMGDPNGWTVKRNASSGSRLPCDTGWGTVKGASCTILGVYMSDSGSYWCESEKAERSNVVNITVSSDSVILESPVLPVDQGDPVSLRCLYRGQFDKSHTSDFEASFFKDGVFVGNRSPGLMRFSAVSRKHQGRYKCQHPTNGKSSEVPLNVRETSYPTTLTPTLGPPVIKIPLPRLLCFILLFILYTIILFIAISVYIRWARARADAKQRGEECLM